MGKILAKFTRIA